MKDGCSEKLVSKGEDSDYNYFAWPAATAAPVATFFDKVGRERGEKQARKRKRKYHKCNRKLWLKLY